MERFKVLVGAPSGGTSFDAASKARWLCSLEHDASVMPSTTSGPNWNILWSQALTAGKMGKADFYACLHADIDPWFDESQPRWVDTLVRECLGKDADLVSVPIAMKDHKAVLSCGIGNPENPWCPLKRLTVRELKGLPVTFNQSDLGYPDFPLLHNDGCWIADLRKPIWYEPRAMNEAAAYFQWMERLHWEGDRCVPECASPDWTFSKMLHEIGAKTYLTQGVKTLHYGIYAWPNFGDWGDYENGDEDTARYWRDKVA
jgi:hypothetical protein